MNRAAVLAAVLVLASTSDAFAQPEESAVVKARDWKGMTEIAAAAQKSGDVDLAKRKYQEAWNYAMFWTVYDPNDRDSGSRRADGMHGLQKIRDAAGGLGLGDTFRQLDDLRAEKVPLVFSGGAKNIGVWRDDENHLFTLKQTGARVTGRHEDPESGFAIIFEGREFNGTTMQIVADISVGGKVDPVHRLTGELTLDGNRLHGKVRNPKGGTNTFELIRTWNGTK